MHESRFWSPLLLASLGVVALACSKSEDLPSGSAAATSDGSWTCANAEVPMGEAIRCSQSALIIDESVGNPEPCTGPTDNPELCTTYQCSAGEPGCPSTSDAPPSSSSSGSTPASPPPPDECSFVDDLPYCGAPIGDQGGGDTSTTGTGSDATCKGKCAAPGQEKKNDATSSGSTSSSSSGGETGGGGPSQGGPKHYTCTKDDKGNKSCVSEPTSCGLGTHPSACGACVSDGSTCDCVPPADGGCWVTGGGFIEGANDLTSAAADGHDNFGGNAKPMKDGHVQGHWNHVDHGTGNHAKGRPEYIVCRHVDEPGPGQPGGKKGFTMNQVFFGGPAEWGTANTTAGYWFDVVAKDHGEPGSQPKAKNGFMPDTYHFTIRKMDDPTHAVSGAVVYETHASLSGGNIQLHPPNGGHPYSPMSLPGWVAFEP